MNTYLGAAAGQDLATGVQRLIPLIKESKGWAWLLGVVNPGTTLLAAWLLSKAPQGVILPATLAVGLLQQVMTLFLILGLIRLRVDQDAQRQTAESPPENSEADHDQVD